MILVFELKSTPPAEWYFPPGEFTEVLTKFPLNLYFCEECFHIQLLDILDPNYLFRNYIYSSESSPGLIKHFESYFIELHKDLQLTSQDFVIDVGSNDGLLLKIFKSKGIKILGIEPAINLAMKNQNEEIPVINDFLNEKTVSNILDNFGKATVVTANNVFAHSDDLFSMAVNIKKILSEDGYFIFEVSSLLDLINGKVFDWIYHEHLSYHSLISLIPFLRKAGMKIVKIKRIDTKGGSFRIYATHLNFKESLYDNMSIENQINLELKFGLNRVETFLNFANEINQLGNKIKQSINDIKMPSRKMVGYGASATTTTLLYNFDLIGEFDFLVDDNPIRWGTLFPGSALEVKNPTHLTNLSEFDVMITAWRFAKPIIKKLRTDFDFKNGQIIVPLPDVKIIS